MQKLALFPMTKDQCAIARYQSLLAGFELDKLYVPQFWGLNGADVFKLDG